MKIIGKPSRFFWIIYLPLFVVSVAFLVLSYLGFPLTSPRLLLSALTDWRYAPLPVTLRYEDTIEWYKKIGGGDVSLSRCVQNGNTFYLIQGAQTDANDKTLILSESGIELYYRGYLMYDVGEVDSTRGKMPYSGRPCTLLTKTF